MSPAPPPSNAVLMIAFHFPPMKGSSGQQRTLGFARHLPKLDWQPVVLTCSERAYPTVNRQEMSLIPANTIVKRSFCLDAARHLAVRGRYASFYALPDRWANWVIGGSVAGKRVLSDYKPRVIWSTYPIATAHIIAARLARRSGIPWVADFRDPMVELDPRTQAYFPADSALRKSRLKVERLCAREATALVFCTNAARDICLERYPELDTERCYVIPNGFEESLFALAEKKATWQSASDERPLKLLHSGTIYQSADRDPKPFFDAVARLMKQGSVSPSRLQVVLRAAGQDSWLKRLIADRGIGDIVKLQPSTPYIDALTEMLSADGLLLLQGYTSNPAIPAKLYEYLRAKRPILALTDKAGSTAALLERLDVGRLAAIEESEHIEPALLSFLEDMERGHGIGTDKIIGAFSRSALTEKLAEVFGTLDGLNRSERSIGAPPD